MISHISIRNFQIHRKLDLELEQVTTIVGPSDVGKSSILRALEWACTNRAAGTDFRTNGKQQCGARLTVDERTITRTKGKEVNEYKLDDSTYKALGSDVPEPISNLLNVGPLNFQAQIDSAFWLSDTSGQVAKNLNAIVDLGEIDTVMGKLASKQREAKATIMVSERRLKEARERAAEQKIIKTIHLELEEVEQLGTVADERRQNAAQLRLLVQDGSQVELEGDRAAEAFVACREAVSVGQKAAEAQQMRDLLNSLILQITELPKIDGTAIAADLKRLTERKDSYEAATERFERICALVDLADSVGRELRTAEIDCAETERKINKETGGKCPVCQRPIQS